MACKVMWYGGLTDNKKLCKWTEFLVILEFEERFSSECKIYIWCFITFLPKKLHEWNLRFVPRTGMGTSVYICSCGVVESCGSQNATPGKGRWGRCLWPIRWELPPPHGQTWLKRLPSRVATGAISEEPISAIVAELCDGWKNCVNGIHEFVLNTRIDW